MNKRGLAKNFVGLALFFMVALPFSRGETVPTQAARAADRNSATSTRQIEEQTPVAKEEGGSSKLGDDTSNTMVQPLEKTLAASKPPPEPLQKESYFALGRLSEQQLLEQQPVVWKKHQRRPSDQPFKTYRYGVGIYFFSYLGDSEGGSFVLPQSLPNLFFLSRVHPKIEIDLGLGTLQTGVMNNQNLQFSDLNFRAVVHFHPFASRRRPEPLFSFNIFAGLRADVLNVSNNQATSSASYLGGEIGIGFQMRLGRHFLFRFLELGGLIQGKLGGDVLPDTMDHSFLSDDLHTGFFIRSGIAGVF